MSFLDSVLSSIETGKPSRIPPVSSPLAAPVTSSTAKADVHKPSTGSRYALPERKLVATGTKRKAEEPLQRPQRPDSQPPRKTTSSKPISTAATPKPRPRPAAPTGSKPATSSGTTTAKSAPVSSKPPPKGSYAEIMMKAKQLQDKAPTKVGMFKHQAVPKEKLSKMERKKRAMEAQAKDKEARLSKKPGAAATSSVTKPSDGKPGLKREPEQLSYKGTARPTNSPAAPEYRGTAGIAPRRDPNSRNARPVAGRRKMDEYLGTDEEDEGDYADEYDDYYSDASSDMEGGFNDMEEEEAMALASARKEDEEEWRAELAAKREKEERRKKLASLAARR